MILFKIEFTFNLASILAFLTGIVSGVILFVLCYSLYFLVNLKKQEVNINDITKNISVDQIKEEIKKSQTEFLRIRKENHQITFDSFREICLELMNTIASLYYPNSKHPLSELTIKEMILLDQYLMTKLEKLLSHVGLKFVKKIKVSRIIDLLNMKKTIDNNSVIQATKNISSFSSKFFAIINFINPVMWIKRGIVNPSINYLSKKICLHAIAIVGQETYHVYSKQAFLDPVLDQEIEELINIIEKENNPEKDIKNETKKSKTKKKVKI